MVVEFGPVTDDAKPETITTPVLIGKAGFEFEKYPIPLVVPTAFPERQVTLLTCAQGEFINTF
jgi:hypothetical protein